MPANERSASVGGASAGGVLLAEPEGPWHFTWPDVIAKGIGDLRAAYVASRNNPDAEPDDNDDEYPAPPRSPGARVPAAAPASSATPARTGSSSYLMLGLAVAGVFLLPKLLR